SALKYLSNSALMLSWPALCGPFRFVWSFRIRAHSASKTRVNALMGTPRNDDLPKWRIAAYAFSRGPHARSASPSAPILHLKDGQISANACVGKTRQKPVLDGQIRPS